MYKESQYVNTYMRGVGLLDIKIGIPRSLFYYKFIPLWKAFFTELGAEVIISDHTNKRILDDGIKACVDEACLPVKIFHGHMMNLKDRVDYIFVPRFTSISKMEYICPEFGGLPDMVRHSLKNIPALITTEINMRKSDKGAIKAAIETAAVLGAGKSAAKAALKTAIDAYREFRCQALCGTLPFSGSSICRRDKSGEPSLQSHDMQSSLQSCYKSGEPSPQLSPQFGTAARMRVAVIGHPYNIYDPYISMNMLGKLDKYDVDVTTIEMVGDNDIHMHASKLTKPMFWNFGRNAYGAAVHLAASGAIDGMICVTSFGCGIDSFVYEFIERKVRREYRIPLITITIDEHSGEAGFNTRLEAFIDMLHWRRINENNISASG